MTEKQKPFIDCLKTLQENLSKLDLKHQLPDQLNQFIDYLDKSRKSDLEAKELTAKKIKNHPEHLEHLYPIVNNDCKAELDEIIKMSKATDQLTGKQSDIEQNDQNNDL